MAIAVDMGRKATKTKIQPDLIPKFKFEMIFIYCPLHICVVPITQVTYVRYKNGNIQGRSLNV